MSRLSKYFDRLLGFLFPRPIKFQFATGFYSGLAVGLLPLVFVFVLRGSSFVGTSQPEEIAETIENIQPLSVFRRDEERTQALFLQLQQGLVGIEAPDTVDTDEPFLLKFHAEYTREEQESILESMSLDSKNLTTFPALVAPLVEAHIESHGFEVELLGGPAARRFNNDMRLITWTWRMKPLSEGSHQVHIGLFAHEDLAGLGVPRTVRTVSKTIVVDVRRFWSGLSLASSWVTLAFLSALISAIVAWFVNKKLDRERAES